MRQQPHVSSCTSLLQHMHGLEGWSSHHALTMMTPTERTYVSRSPRQVQWDSDISEHDEEYSPSYDTRSTGRRVEWTDTPTPFAEDENELYEMRRENTSLCRSEENRESGHAQLWNIQREMHSPVASVRTLQGAQQESWPVPPPPIKDHFPTRREEEKYDDWLLPPPWPSA